MAGTFQTDRAIFGNRIWKNIIDFRLFFFLYGNALYKGSQKYNEVEIKRGQFLRSYRKLAGDLEYTEHNTIKQYSLHALKDSINRLIEDGRIEAKETGIGTLFTIKNYNEYQIFNSGHGNTLGNSTGTAREQHGNNKKKENTEKKENNTTITAPDKPDAEFGVFWETYPKKAGKFKALEAWNKKHPPLDKCLSTLAWQVTSEQWTKDKGQFIPLPATWINQGRWQDEPLNSDRKSADYQKCELWDGKCQSPSGSCCKKEAKYIDGQCYI